MNSFITIGLRDVNLKIGRVMSVLKHFYHSTFLSPILKYNFSYLVPCVSYRLSGENLFKYREN